MHIHGNDKIGNDKIGNAVIGRMEWPFSATVLFRSRLEMLRLEIGILPLYRITQLLTCTKRLTRVHNT